MGDFGYYGGFGLFGIGFAVMFVVVGAFIAFVIVMMITQFVRLGRQRAATAAANAAAPEVQAQVRVIGKRMENLGHTLDGGVPALPSRHTVAVHTGDGTIYQRNLVTFEQAGGARFELELPSDQFGLIAEGDLGTVTMKGTEFLGFARAIMR